VPLHKKNSQLEAGKPSKLQFSVMAWMLGWLSSTVQLSLPISLVRH
jgi:hypothetical protein